MSFVLRPVLPVVLAALVTAMLATACAGATAIAAQTDLPVATTAVVPPTVTPLPSTFLTAEERAAEVVVEEREDDIVDRVAEALDAFPEPRYDSFRIPRSPENEAAGIASGATVSEMPGVLAMGYSNTFRVFRSHEVLFTSDFNLVNAAQGGREADDWAETDGPWIEAKKRIREDPVLGTLPDPAGAIEVAIMQFTLVGTAEPRVEYFRESVNAVIDRLAVEYPNMKQVFIMGRDFGGWTETLADDGTPFAGEPGNWSSSIAVDLVIEDNADRSDGIWVGTGPYLWANGDTPRADGLTWPRDAYVEDGRHLSLDTARFVATTLDDFLTADPAAPWYSTEPAR